MRTEEYIEKLEASSASVRFDYLARVCQEVFGNARIRGSHHIFRMPWPGDPRINLQKVKGQSNAKPYQVKQVIAALRKMQEAEETEKRGEAQHVEK
jgi:hypothetical protein